MQVDKPLTYGSFLKSPLPPQIRMVLYLKDCKKKRAVFYREGMWLTKPHILNICFCKKKFANPCSRWKGREGRGTAHAKAWRLFSEIM